MKTRTVLKVRGTVQGVGFRPFVYRLATDLKLHGTVKNLGDSGVEIVLEGEKEKVKKFEGRLGEEIPPLADIKQLDKEERKFSGFEEFQIVGSSEASRGSGTIPPDTAICDDCLKDVKNEKSRYSGYWATSCVNCGPRFSVVKELPYDRRRTSMGKFDMCKDCSDEYENPGDRRYHAQTIACPNCGPELFSVPSRERPIQSASEILEQGGIIALKGAGGTHLACDARKDGSIQNLKEKLNRREKPLAVMVPGLDYVDKIARTNKREREALKSVRRPIVVLEERNGSPLSQEVSPELSNVGIMLPYTGLHHLIFENIDFPIVMTSANSPGKPMLVENERIKQMEDIADLLLLHERKVEARCDDSVVRFSDGERRFIRRSRGWTPEPLEVDLGNERILGLGGEFGNTVAVYKDGNCYLSQHIGDVDNMETLNFLKESIGHMKKITGTESFDLVACDMHPGFMTTELAEEFGTEVQKIQHHHAHLASVLGENEEEEIVGIVADGTGYGDNGNVWGGEVIYTNGDSFERFGSLSKMLMPGGEKAIQFPSRMIAGILYDDDMRRILDKHGSFPRGPEERETVIRQTEERLNTPTTTSAGRFLDAVSSLLNICRSKSYQGEPALKLESAAVNGTPLDIELDFKREGGRRVLDVQKIFRRMVELKENGVKKQDIAATAQKALGKGLGKIAARKAEDKGLEKIGFTGGVAYNGSITRAVRNEVERKNLELISNRMVPCGDGGISFGQTVVAGRS